MSPRSQSETERKLPKLQIFQLLQENLTTVGIRLDLAAQPHQWNGKIFMGFVTLCFMNVCIFKYIFDEAQTFFEYTQSIYMGSLAILIMLCLFITILKVKKLAEILSDCENIINTRKQQQTNANFVHKYDEEPKIPQFSIKIFSIKINFHSGQSTRGKTHGNSVHCFRKTYTRMLYAATDRL